MGETFEFQNPMMEVEWQQGKKRNHEIEPREVYKIFGCNERLLGGKWRGSGFLPRLELDPDDSRGRNYLSSPESQLTATKAVT